MKNSQLQSKLAENLKKIRTEQGLSQGDIALKIGADRAYISGIENGKRNLTITTVEKLAHALNTSVENLIT